MGSIKVSVELDNKGVGLNILKINHNKIGFCRTDEVIKSVRKTYDELGLEIKEAQANE